MTERSAEGNTVPEIPPIRQTPEPRMPSPEQPIMPPMPVRGPEGPEINEPAPSPVENPTGTFN